MSSIQEKQEQLDILRNQLSNNISNAISTSYEVKEEDNDISNVSNHSYEVKEEDNDEEEEKEKKSVDSIDHGKKLAEKSQKTTSERWRFKNKEKIQAYNDNTNRILQEHPILNGIHLKECVINNEIMALFKNLSKQYPKIEMIYYKQKIFIEKLQQLIIENPEDQELKVIMKKINVLIENKELLHKQKYDYCIKNKINKGQNFLQKQIKKTWTMEKKEQEKELYKKKKGMNIIMIIRKKSFKLNKLTSI